MSNANPRAVVQASTSFAFHSDIVAHSACTLEAVIVQHERCKVFSRAAVDGFSAAESISFPDRFHIHGFSVQSP